MLANRARHSPLRWLNKCIRQQAGSYGFPPTKMDAHQLTEEGYYGIYGKAGARMEMPHNPDVRFDADPL
ncbi:MAG TPA: hypothetical protein VF672_11190 [Pseudomonas sp.]